jgi:hypothetical protein
VPGVEGAECEDLDDCEAGGVNGFQFATEGPVADHAIGPFFALIFVREEPHGSGD